MDKVLDIGKHGWHPQSTGSVKGDIKSWVGRGKQLDLERAEEHVSQPLSSLKDPTSFGPPPKNINHYGGADGSSARAGGEDANSNSLSSPVVLDEKRLQKQEEYNKDDKPELPQGPYRINTTGLSTDNLPKPPVRRTDHEPTDGVKPSPATTHPAPHPLNKPKPSLPPRLPPRESSPTASTPRGPVPKSPPPPYTGSTDSHQQATYLPNQDEVARLSRAGVKVPALGTGSENSNEGNDISKDSSSRSSASISANVSELQSRFAKLNSPVSHENPARPTSPSKKPPLPPKRLDLHSSSKNSRHNSPEGNAAGASKPPPVPLGTKPK